MPSPLGHAIGGAAVGWAVAGGGLRERARSTVWRLGAWFALLGMLPDLDLLGGVHRGPSHSIGAALIVGASAAALTSRPLLAVAAAAAYGSHSLLDWLGSDTSTPVGVMALWPLSRAYYQAGIQVFDSVWRHNETPDFWVHNALAVARELIILVPLAALALLRTGVRPPGR